MVAEKISLQQIQDEIADMLDTCFEGEIYEQWGGIVLSLPGGQRFFIQIAEA